MTGTPSEVKIQAELTDIIFTRQRLKRGDWLALLLFSLALEYVARKVNMAQMIQYHISHLGSWHMLTIYQNILSARDMYSYVKSESKTIGFHINAIETKGLFKVVHLDNKWNMRLLM
jgi:hypothetical protein